MVQKEKEEISEKELFAKWFLEDLAERVKKGKKINVTALARGAQLLSDFGILDLRCAVRQKSSWIMKVIKSGKNTRKMLRKNLL